MSPRSIRRAAERKANKLARKAARQSVTEQPITTPTAPEERTGRGAPGPFRSGSPVVRVNNESIDFDPPKCLADFPLPEIEDAPAPKPISESRLAANRANAQLSTGPTSSDGKAKSSLNAVKTALTGRTVLLPTDDAAAYQQHVSDFEKEYLPVGARESALVQSIADTFWRLDRIRSLEWAIFARGHAQFAENFEHETPSTRPALIDLHTFLTYEKQLRNLQLQEARLHRRREKDTAELRQLQQERNRREREELETAAKLYTKAQHDNEPFDPADLGFEFSTADIEAYLEGVRARNLLKSTLKPERHAAPQAKAA